MPCSECGYSCCVGVCWKWAVCWYRCTNAESGCNHCLWPRITEAGDEDRECPSCCSTCLRSCNQWSIGLDRCIVDWDDSELLKTIPTKTLNQDVFTEEEVDLPPVTQSQIRDKFRYQKQQVQAEMAQLNSERENRTAGEAAEQTVFPPNWSGTGSGPLKTIDLDPSENMYQELKNEIGAKLRSWPVKKIQCSENREQYEVYFMARSVMKKKVCRQDPSMNLDLVEKTLWHGVLVEDMNAIVRSGFSINKNKINKRFEGPGPTYKNLGLGLYFSECPNYWKDLPPSNDGYRILMRCKVLVGKPHPGKGADERECPTNYNSVEGKDNGHIVYVVFNEAHAYPEYVVTLR